MGNQTISQIDEKHKDRALILCAEGHVRRDGNLDTFHVLSQTSLKTWMWESPPLYEVSLSPTISCTCTDFLIRHSPCKHIIAAQIFSLSEQAAQDLATRKRLSLEEFESLLIQDLATRAGDSRMTQKLRVLLSATQRLLQRATGDQLQAEIEELIASKKQWHSGETIHLSSPGHFVKQQQMELILWMPSGKHREVGYADLEHNCWRATQHPVTTTVTQSLGM